MKKNYKKICKIASLVVASSLFLTSCGGTSTDSTDDTASTFDVSYQDLVLGEDYTDLSADIKFITNKTDIIDTTMREYADEFNEMYPNINIEYEGITNYADEIMLRLTTGDWGDICMIPPTMSKDELPNYFQSFGTQTDLGEIYQEDLLNNYTYEGETYGIPYMVVAQGIVYNKQVFEDAGITDIPTTPDEFLEALQMIKDNTDAIPLYTNFASGWTMTQWDQYIDATATGDPDYKYEGLTIGENPFSDRGDETGPYAVYKILYDAVSMGLTEDDPTTTDWEGSKGMINNGQIGTMVLGSWAVTQMQEAGDNGDDIAYMPFPISVDGEQYTLTAPDYNYGINKNVSDDEKIASMLFVKFLVEQSSFADDEGGISVVLDAEMPDTLSDFENVTLIANNSAPEGEETLFDDINNESELGINSSGAICTEIVESATTGDKTFEDLVNEWNEKWTKAQEKFGVEN